MNSNLTILQYSFLILVIYVMFLAGSIVMTPFAFVKSLIFKFQQVMSARSTKEQALKMAMFIVYAALGLPILVLALFADFYYFWQNNFRSNLKKIIIEKTKSTLSSTSIKDIVNLSNKYAEQKIRSVYSIDLVKTFRTSFNVPENIQYLLFGQMVNGDDIQNQLAHLQGGTGIKSLKTTNLRAY